MSTETQRAELIQFLKDYACGGSNYNDKMHATAAMLEAQAAELAALKADIATYVHIASEQATEIEVLRKALDAARREIVTFSFHLKRDDFAIAGGSFVEQCLASTTKTIATIDASMQTKEAS